MEVAIQQLVDRLQQHFNMLRLEREDLLGRSEKLKVRMESVEGLIAALQESGEELLAIGPAFLAVSGPGAQTQEPVIAVAVEIPAPAPGPVSTEEAPATPKPLTIAPHTARILRAAFAGGEVTRSLNEALVRAYGEPGWRDVGIARILGPSKINRVSLAEDIVHPKSMLKGMLRQAIRTLEEVAIRPGCRLAPILSNLLTVIDFSNRAEEILKALRNWGVDKKEEAA